METLIFGIIGFVIFYTYDINSIIWRNKLIDRSFFIGFVFVFFETVLVMFGNLNDVNQNPYFLGVGISSSLLFAALLLHALFFAIPFEETYIHSENGRSVHDKGHYALCRHPGFIWFSLFYMALCIIIPSQASFKMAVVFITLNLIYIIMQDLWIFPRVFSNYMAYKKTTPFLIPTIKSIRRSIDTLGGNGHES